MCRVFRQQELSQLMLHCHKGTNHSCSSLISPTSRDVFTTKLWDCASCTAAMWCSVFLQLWLHGPVLLYRKVCHAEVPFLAFILPFPSTGVSFWSNESAPQSQQKHLYQPQPCKVVLFCLPPNLTLLAVTRTHLRGQGAPQAMKGEEGKQHHLCVQPPK